MVMTVHARISIREDDPALNELRRLTMAGERVPVAVRRALNRYAAMMANTTPSPGDIVRDISHVVVSTRIDLLGRIGYPDREELLNAISSAPVDASLRRKLEKYVERLTYPEYAKLIEAVELMYRS